MKTLLPTLFVCCCLWASLSAQTTVQVETEPCRGRMQVFGMNGVGYALVARMSSKKVKTMEDGVEVTKEVFTWNSPATSPKVYYIGTSMRDFFPVVVGVDSLVKAVGKCGNLRRSTIMGSTANVAYHRVLTQLNQHNATASQLTQTYVSAQQSGDEEKEKEQLAALQALDEKKIALLDQLKRENPFLGRIAAVNTLLAYQVADHQKYPTALKHYLGTVWQFTDFSDPGYNGMNIVYEASVNHTKTLITALTGTALEETLNAYIDKWPEGSEARLYAMGGVFAMLNNRRKSAAALTVGERIEAEFGETHAQAVAAMGKEFNKLRTSVPGAKAPELSGSSPDGTTINLSDLKGKVVLVDFWASWCGPCRRENPNVVRMYEKYSDQGFEILGVSLDREKSRWEKAIADDGLNWLHISDLKHWKSEHAALYGVRSIPDTVLLDADGNIIARNLRGAQLEQRLSKIFDAGK